MMPGTTRYSATFDRTYEEEDVGAPITRRSRSHSLQVDSNGRAGIGPLFNGLSDHHVRSSSTENKDQASGIPARTATKTPVKAHNNPFQFVKVSSCPLSRKAEEQLKKTVKKAPTFVEEEEEWQSNLDSWKSRRRKMSEDVIQRQEEIRKLQQEDEDTTTQQLPKKTKTFSEIVEERAHRGRALSLCLFSSPLESSEWIFENKKHSSRCRSHDLLSEESAESSNINSEEENDNYKQDVNFNNERSAKTNGHTGSVQNSTSNSSISKISDLSELDVSHDLLDHKDHHSSAGFIDSGLESLSSSHRAGDIPDSGSDFSQDSGSSIDCDSPRVSSLITTGVELLEEYCSKEDVINGNSTPKEQSSAICKPKNEPLTNGKSSNTKISGSKVEQIKNSLKSKSSNTSKPPPPSKKEIKSKKSIEKQTNAGSIGESAKLQTTDNAPKGYLSDLMNDSSFNVIYQSKAPVQCKNGIGNENGEKNGNSFPLLAEVPVDKVTEEMERLILQQLEEEERTKELCLGDIKGIPDDKMDIDLSVRKAQPPKEKPPPPPPSTQNNASTKDPSVKRVNSTKRILKEINQRRSDFLGIDPSKQGAIVTEPPVKPPPTLENFLRVERELDRQQQQLLELSASLAHNEEDEISRKEREIIENLETQERLRKAHENARPEKSEVPSSVNANRNELKNTQKNKSNVNAEVPDFTDTQLEEKRLKELKEERKRMEEEIQKAQEQKKRMEEALLLQKREEQIKLKEEINVSDTSTALSSNAHGTNNSNVDSLPNSVSNANVGDGKTNSLGLVSSSSIASSSTPDEQVVTEKELLKPNESPKPMKKKKEVLRKERERLRQEQEELQREREEHRRKVQLEAELSKKKSASISHVDGPVARVGPPPPAKPTMSSQALTPLSSVSSLSPSSSSSHTSQDAQGPCFTKETKANGSSPAGMQSQCKPVISKVRGPIQRPKVSSNDVRNQPKVPSPRKQDAVEPRYNQNHWLIQEAEMRRIAEQKERQRLQSNGIHPQSVHYPEDYVDIPPVLQRPVVAQNGPPSNYAQHQPNAGKLLMKKSLPPPPPAPHMDSSHYLATYSKHFELSLPPPAKPLRTSHHEAQDQVLSVSGRKRCSHCGVELGRGAAMIIESLQLYYHIQCFSCCVCQAQLGNGSCGTDVRVRNNKLHCHNCYSNDEAGLKFSQV